jgi:hypothetical protein
MWTIQPKEKPTDPAKAKFKNDCSKGHAAAIPISIMQQDPAWDGWIPEFVKPSSVAMSASQEVNARIASIGIKFKGTPPAPAPRQPKQSVQGRVDKYKEDQEGKGTPDIPLTVEEKEKLRDTNMLDFQVMLQCCPVGVDMGPRIGPYIEAGLVWEPKKCNISLFRTHAGESCYSVAMWVFCCA